MKTVAVVGLGYVGLPLAVAFAEHWPTIGYDLSARKVDLFRNGVDPTGEVGGEMLKAATGLELTSDPEAIGRADYVVVAVPTPIDEIRRPDFGPLEGASRTVGKYMKRGAVVIFESTVYPGATEETCVPILEEHSGMKWKADFHIGYSPERINPGDQEHRLHNIVKVVSGDDPDTLEQV
ncbi:MAG TPA: nucleotide sugar dehydrogenase, partial [Gammaproteobacteria bacterium]|nr:nucleotide sugar dehydrogenase [Gammaproteobacteria bacterium]